MPIVMTVSDLFHTD